MEKFSVEQIKEKFKKEGEVRSLELSIDREQIDEEKQIIPMSVSSDKPYKRYFGWETLDHKAKSIRLERFKAGAAFRDTHFGDQAGVILNPRVDKEQGKLRVDVQFSKNDDRAVTLFRDMRDGIRKNVSVRYIIHEMILEKETAEEAWYRVTDWEPIHASVEADPADISVGPGRSAEDIEEENKELKSRIKILTNNKSNGGDSKMTPEELKQKEDEFKRQAEEKSKAEVKRVQGIYAAVNLFREQVKDDFDINAEAQKAVEDELSVNDFSDKIFKSVRERQALRTEDAKIGMTEKEVRAFSITRAVRSVITRNPDIAKFEMEASKAARELYGADRESNFTIPYDVISASHFGRLAGRELSVGTATAGGNLVGTNLLASQFEDVLRNYAVTLEAGVIPMAGLKGNVAIPKKTAAGSATWVSSEGTDATDTNMTFGQISLSPKTIAARTEWTRQLALQATPAIDRIAEDDLIKSLGIAIDLGVLHGTGSSGQPTGVAGVSGIKDVEGAGFGFATAVEFKKQVKLANAFKEFMSYITNPTIEASCEVTPKAGSYPVFLLQDGKMAGHTLRSTNQVSTGYMFFADWSTVILAMWGGLDVIVDAISSNDGNVKIKVFQSVDVAVRQAGAIAVSDDVAFS